MSSLRRARGRARGRLGAAEVGACPAASRFVAAAALQIPLAVRPRRPTSRRPATGCPADLPLRRCVAAAVRTARPSPAARPLSAARPPLAGSCGAWSSDIFIASGYDWEEAIIHGQVHELVSAQAPILGEDAVVDTRLPKLEDDGYPSLDVLREVNLVAVVALGLGDEAAELVISQLALLHMLRAHGLQELAHLQGRVRPVLIVGLVPDVD
mmetsp:Transcript_4964/g.12794  ORF Transcript_4964/g.12794 Transcript_4964/m.12794 type:complete len:211 (-) Transcript_4964:1683-2315(-)